MGLYRFLSGMPKWYLLSGGAYVGVSGVFIFNVGVGCLCLPFRGDNVWEGIIEGCLYVNLSAVSMSAS